MAKKRINELNELNMADYIFNESGESSEKTIEKSSPKKGKVSEYEFEFSKT